LLAESYLLYAAVM